MIVLVRQLAQVAACEYCGEVFKKRNANRVNCSMACYVAARSGKPNGRYMAARTLRPDGYYYVRDLEKGKPVLEHRKILERALGRKLDSGEVVHHINGVKTDNRVGNLRPIISNARHIQCYHTPRTPCAICGSVTIKGRAKGLCSRCYHRLWSRAKRGYRAKIKQGESRNG